VTALLALGARFSDVNLLAYLAAFGGGVVSFLSPCVLSPRIAMPSAPWPICAVE